MEKELSFLSSLDKFIFSKSIWPLLCMFSVLITNMYALEKRSTKLDLSTSVIIPCHYRHANYLQYLLLSYAKQSVLPDEIIISLSQSHLVETATKLQITSKPWPFKVRLIQSEEKLLAGPNRNRAFRYSNGDILLYQDADDIPTKDRVEIIKYFFEHYEIEHLMHKFSGSRQPIKSSRSIEKTPCQLIKNNSADVTTMPYVTNGNIAITRNIARFVAWPHVTGQGEDQIFNQRVHDLTHETLFVRKSLLIYRNHLSCFTGESRAELYNVRHIPEKQLEQTGSQVTLQNVEI